MDSNTELENTVVSNDREVERKDLDIYNLVPEIEASYTGSPLSPQTADILNEFERDQKGGVIREGNYSILNYSELVEDKINQNSKEYIDKVQAINPEVPFENIPLYLLSSPVTKIACALKGKGIAINTRTLLENQGDGKFIANTLVHEATHVFINRLGKEPDFLKGEYKREILDFLWFEGLAQYMEPYPDEISKMFKEDADKWTKILNSWFKTDSEQEKGDILDSILNMESTKKILTYRHGKEKGERIDVLLKISSKDEALQALIVREGFGYYIGKYLWEEEIKKGKNLKDIVMKGSKDIDNWIA